MSIFTYSFTISNIEDIMDKAKNSLLELLEKEGLIVNAEKISKRYFSKLMEAGGNNWTIKFLIDPFVEIFDQELKEDGSPVENKKAKGER